MDKLKSCSTKSAATATDDEVKREGRSVSRTASPAKHEKSATTLEDQYHTEDLHLHYPPRRRSWYARPKSPGLKWYKEYTSESSKCGRVLVIDYVKQDLTTAGKRKVASQEIHDLEALRKLYASPTRGTEAILRLFHVQNAPWATQFLLRKFNINARDDLVGLDFDRYLRFKRPEGKGRKLAMSGKTWKTQHDPWRGVSKTAFGVDYLKPYRVSHDTEREVTGISGKIMELNCFDHDENPCYGWDVYVQRLSCYVQHKEAVTQVDPEIRNPYKQIPGSGGTGYDTDQYHLPRLEDLDSGSAILLFEESVSGSIEDTVIASRRATESRWRRLPFYLAFESPESMDDDQMALQCTKMIMQDIWESTAEAWEGFLQVGGGHVGILEDRIYENPADESLAPLLWTNSDMWLNVERLMLVHKSVVRECQANLRELADRLDTWLENTSGDFERLSNLIQEDLIKPTTGLADLMYKSVGIRDARHAVELSISLWRLSWITFIFLPLTFLCGFFSMQVSVFANSPSLMWYFTAAVPMMLAVFASWYILKQFLDGARNSPYARGIYEALFQSLARNYPVLWTRTGPRQSIKLSSRLERIKWWLIVYWSTPEKTTGAGAVNDDSLFDGLGAWSRLKRRYIRQWTSQIQNTEQLQLQAPLGAGGVASAADGLEANKMFVNMANIPANTEAEGLQVPFDLNKRVSVIADSTRRSGSARRPSTSSSGGRNSAVMVEEERLDWLENP